MYIVTVRACEAQFQLCNVRRDRVLHCNLIQHAGYCSDEKLRCRYYSYRVVVSTDKLPQALTIGGPLLAAAYPTRLSARPRACPTVACEHRYGAAAVAQYAISCSGLSGCSAQALCPLTTGALGHELRGTWSGGQLRMSSSSQRSAERQVTVDSQRLKELAEA